MIFNFENVSHSSYIQSTTHKDMNSLGLCSCVLFLLRSASMFYVYVIGGASAGMNIRAATAISTKQQYCLFASIIYSIRLLVARSFTNTDPHRNETRSYATYKTRINRIDRMEALLKTALTSQT